MRYLGEITGRKSAERFVAHLLTQDVATHIEAVGDFDRWEIWIRNEDQLQLSRQQLNEFLAAPQDPKYEAAIVRAKEILNEKAESRKQIAQNIRTVRPSRPISGGLIGGGATPPLTLTLMILCIGLHLLSSLGGNRQSNNWSTATSEQLSFLTIADYQASNHNPAASIMKGEIWRVITPIFLHANMIHLAMNMLGMYVFGRLIERLLGTPRYALFILLLAIVPNLVQGLTPAVLGGSPFFVGISGVIYGFIGYLWMRSSINPRFPIRIPAQMLILAVGMIVLGLSGLIKDWHMADLCHLAGLVVGGAIGYAAEYGNSP
ncbi:MAG: rhomboid family intramembrane serine protease [Planctomycetales bacterium]|nr:rhomboid family intramembrane serine protease [Planctomycetales bacterium]